ncbi:MAG: alpha/beta hydrolase [Ilumatobacteraceae bacterium]|nr:alpha/beta hydrolase [Ilumatobacteraceae bacterium]
MATCSDAVSVTSADGTSIALHELSPATSSNSSSPVLFSHATGFHAHCWQPIADVLRAELHCMAFDHRGFGDSQKVDPATLKWADYGDDALAAARATTERHAGAGLIGVGHSMGGATLLMAALAEPSLFRALFIFEPIVFPPMPSTMSGDTPSNFLADGARKRRSSFDSFDAALTNFASKPPMNSFHPVARESYVRHGFAGQPDGTVTLKCAPEHEARTYETGGAAPEWHELPGITVPTWVLCGRPEPLQPSRFAANVSEQLGNSTYVQWDEMGHFGPFTHPEELAGFIGRTVRALA